MKFVRRHLVLALTVIMLMSVMVLAVSAKGKAKQSDYHIKFSMQF